MSGSQEIRVLVDHERYLSTATWIVHVVCSGLIRLFTLKEMLVIYPFASAREGVLGCGAGERKAS